MPATQRSPQSQPGTKGRATVVRMSTMNNDPGENVQPLFDGVTVYPITTHVVTFLHRPALA